MLDEFKDDTRVVHCQKEKYDIYIGRPSEWGNPYTHIRDRETKAEFIVKNREEAISKYREWILNQPMLMNRILELDGKILGCWCKPKSCHGDVLVELINKAKQK
jgi:hypothetical protein